MGTILVFIVKSGLYLMLFYLFYSLLLSRHTFFRFNRIVLLGMMITSVLLPFYSPASGFPAETFLPESATTLSGIQTFLVGSSLPERNILVTPTVSVEWRWRIIGFLYLGGALLVLLYTIYSFSLLVKLVKNGKQVWQENGIRLVTTGQAVTPFSWRNYIVLPQTEVQADKAAIILHEMGHIRMYHSWDLILTQLFLILYWFNPVVWLLKRELRTIHEFEADQYVLQKGVKPKQYQLLLITRAAGKHNLLALSHSFNDSQLKKRIRMMLKNRTHAWAWTKYLLIVPFSMLIQTAIARPEVKRILDKVSKVELFPENKKIEKSMVFPFLFEENQNQEESNDSILSESTRQGLDVLYIDAYGKVGNEEEEMSICSRIIHVGKKTDYNTEEDRNKYWKLINVPEKGISSWEEANNEAVFILNSEEVILYVFRDNPDWPNNKDVYVKMMMDKKSDSINTMNVILPDRGGKPIIQIEMDGERLDRMTLAENVPVTVWDFRKE